MQVVHRYYTHSISHWLCRQRTLHTFSKGSEGPLLYSMDIDDHLSKPTLD